MMIALAIGLLAQVTTPSPVPVPAPRPAAAAGIWDQRCKVCHGADGTGQTKKGRELKIRDFTKPRWQSHTTDDEIVTAITNGIRKRKMPAFKGKLSPEEIQALLPYVRALAKK